MATRSKSRSESSALAERRGGPRQPTVSPATLTTDPVTLEGHTLNTSPGGVLLFAQGRLPVVLTIHGKAHRGWVVRAEPYERDTTAYAIQLLDRLDDE